MYMDKVCSIENGGVLDKEYAEERKSKTSLQFRYRLRAWVAASVVRQYMHAQNHIQLVDLGAAEGLTLMEMAKILGQGDYVGYEYNPELIHLAPKLPNNITLVQGDICDLKNSLSETTDVVTALAVLEHLSDPSKAMKEAFRILRKGGLFIASSPSPAWDKLSGSIAGHNKFGGDHHLISVNKAVMIQLARDSGFEFIHYFPFMFVCVGMLSYSRISMSSSTAWRIDRFIQKIKILNGLFVNQCFVLRKPISAK